MAKQTLASLNEKITALQARADALKEKEKATVIARIRSDIATYGITERDLFGAPKKAAATQHRDQGKRTARSGYADGNGNVWGGRGPRPQWLREALARGKQLEDFANTATGSSAVEKPPKPSAKSKRTAARKVSSGNRRVAAPRKATLKTADRKTVVETTKTPAKASHKVSAPIAKSRTKVKSAGNAPKSTGRQRKAASISKPSLPPSPESIETTTQS